MYSLLQLALCLSLLGLGFGKPFSSQVENEENNRAKRQIDGLPSLIDFEIRRASLHSVAQILDIQFCNDDHLSGVVCPGEEDSENPTCASWEEICNSRQFCGADLYDACLEKTIQDYGIPWADFCRGEEKVDYCRLKDFQPIRCGSDIKLRPGAKEVKITSPNYDSDYSNNVFCFWRITAPEGSPIKVSFKDFMTEKNYDYVNVGRGLDYLTHDPSQLILNKFSGPSLPEPAEFVIPNNEIFIAFVADAYDNERGFKVGVRIPKEDDTTEIFEPEEPVIDDECGNPEVIELDGDSVTITSPNYPEPYNPNSQCDWMFNVAAGRRIGIDVLRLDTEYATDVITIGSGNVVGGGDERITRLEGNNIPRKPIVVSNENAWVRFTSDSALERTGFKLTATEVPATGCGGEFEVPRGGSVVVASPNYPNLAYRVNQYCEWRFEAPPGTKLTMEFKDFKTQRFADVVSAGFGEEPAFDWSNYVIIEHSGDGLPEPAGFDTKKNTVWMSFRSDSFIVDRGFKVLVGDSSIYEIGNKAGKGEVHPMNEDCGEVISQEEALSEVVISSPEEGGYYPGLLNCIWVVNIPFGGKVKVQWDQFLTETNRDFFTLGNGSDPTMTSSVVLEDFSGLRAPDEITDVFQSLWIRFQTDLRNNYRGWQLRILPLPYTECGGLLEIPEGGTLAVASPGYPNNYPNSITCRYTVQTTSGTRIMLTITEFDTSYGDYLSVGEGCNPSEGGDLNLDKQSIVRPANYQLMSRSSEIWMKFYTNDYRNRPGWMINLADTKLAPREESRRFGSCEQYTSDPTTAAPPEPTEAPEEPEVTPEETDVVVVDEDPRVHVPDWYDDLEDEEEVKSSTVPPIIPETTTSEIFIEEGSGEFEVA